MAGFVRVSGYNQTDMDNNYQNGYTAGVDYADNRVNPDSASYNAGQASILSVNPVIISFGADKNDEVYRALVCNRTGKTMKCTLFKYMQGNDATCTLSEVPITVPESSFDFPTGADLFFDQRSAGVTNDVEGYVHLAISGSYSNVDGAIRYNDDTERYEGTVTIS